ncbi:fasciclin domain-containing protein, partial [Arachidicoccus sp.]|uniref:fasciclin domain-containing protein n=1 Tax=Arachidicoccus sp. TaxID=1872624 RepID=UPI003D240B28
QFLLSNPDKYSILTSGLQKAGLMDTLVNLTDSLGGRIRLTLFAETNDVLKNAGIENYDNMPHDELVKLMRNHLIPGQNAISSYTHHTVAVPVYNIVDSWDSTILTLDGDDYFYFNLAGVHLIDNVSDFTSSDVAMRNGIIDNVSVPISFPANKPRTQIYYDFWSGTNYAYGIPSISDGNSHPPLNGSSGNYRYYYDGSISNNLLFVNPDAKNDSMVALIHGIRKGKYQITINYKASYNRDIFELRYQNDSIGSIDFRTGTTYKQNTIIGTYDFKTSGDKRLNFVCLQHNGGGMNLDCMVLTPVYDNP